MRVLWITREDGASKREGEAQNKDGSDHLMTKRHQWAVVELNSLVVTTSFLSAPLSVFCDLSLKFLATLCLSIWIASCTRLKKDAENEMDWYITS